jgi:small redox-active disulfide protein 2
VRRTNYVADDAEDDYARALLREYRRSLGEKVEEEHGATEIRILGPGCPRCEELMRRVMTVVAELNLPADVQHVRDVKKISDYGVMFTPGLVIDGEVKASGKVPSLKEIKSLLE